MDAAEVLQRLVEQEHPGDEGQELPLLARAADHGEPAVDDDQRDGGAGRDLGGGKGERGVLLGLLPGARHARVLALEAAPLVRLAPEGLHDAVPEDRLLQQRGQAAGLALPLAAVAAHLAPEAPERVERERQADEAEGRQDRVEPEGHGHERDDAETAAHDGHRGLDERVAHEDRVGGDPGDDVPAGAPREPRLRERQQMAVHVVAQVAHHAQADRGREVALQEAEGGAQQREAHDQPDEHPEHPLVAVVEDVVEDALEQQRDRAVERAEEHHREEREPHPAAVGAQVAEQAPVDPAALLGGRALGVRHRRSIPECSSRPRRTLRGPECSPPFRKGGRGLGTGSNPPRSPFARGGGNRRRGSRVRRCAPLRPGCGIRGTDRTPSLPPLPEGRGACRG